MMKVKFTFTDSLPGDPINPLSGVVYNIYDSEGNNIMENEIEVVDLETGQYCIYATKWAPPEGGNNIYFGEQSFEVPEVAPPKPPIMPPPTWDIWVTVYMTIIPIEEKEETPCPDMWGKGGGSWLWILLLLMLMGGA